MILLLLTGAPFHAAKRDAKPSCAVCMVLQESVGRSIRLNISALASGKAGGLSSSLHLPLRDIIRTICSSEAWTSRNFNVRFAKACSKFIGDPNRDIERKKTPKDTFRFTLFRWREQSAAINAPSGENQNIFGDPSLALRMKRAVCGDSGPYSLGVCSEDELPPISWLPGQGIAEHPCEMCRAIVAGTVGVVQQSRERPSVAAGLDYHALTSRMLSVCEDIPMREPIAEVAAAFEKCQDMWEQYEPAFLRLAVDRSFSYARSLCSNTLNVCAGNLTARQVYALDLQRGVVMNGGRANDVWVEAEEKEDL